MPTPAIPSPYPTRVKITSRGLLKARKVTLVHLKTGRVVSAPSIAAFARRMKWGKNGIFHFDNVLKGHRLHHRGWGMRSVINKKLSLQDIFGNQYKVTVGEVARKIGSIAANKLRREGGYQALTLVSKDLSNLLPPKPYRVTGYVFRSGSRLVRLDTLKEAEEKLGISLHCAWQLTHGYTQSVRGVTFVRAHKVKRQATGALSPVVGA